MKIRLKMSKTILLFVLLIGIITSFSLVSVFAENDDMDTNEINVVNTRNAISTQNDFISIFFVHTNK